MRFHPPEHTSAGTVLSQDDLAAGKVAALCDRAAARDFVLDVAALVSRYNFMELCDLAEAVHIRFDRHRLRQRLQAFPHIARSDFNIDDDQYKALRQLVDNWHIEMGNPGRGPDVETLGEC